MVGYYRLRELGFRLSAGAHVLPKSAFAPIEAATDILVEADAMAAETLAQSRGAYEEERRRGYEEGLAAARLDAAERLLRENDALDRSLAALEGGIVDIVIESVRRLVAEFDDRAKAETLVRRALKQMRREKRAELRVAPSQFDEMRGAIDGIIEDFPEVDLVDVVEDAALEAPQIILETSIGRVEGDLGASLQALEAAIRSAATVVAEPVAIPSDAGPHGGATG
ncbi:MAG: type III secretion system stator protein SctL [Rhizobiaceae bacterium]|nr:type III secretion system stator protein SctL [Rhizobiaceae bacterium]